MAGSNCPACLSPCPYCWRGGEKEIWNQVDLEVLPRVFPRIEIEWEIRGKEKDFTMRGGSPGGSRKKQEEARRKPGAGGLWMDWENREIPQGSLGFICVREDGSQRMVQRRMGQRGWCTEGSSEKDGAQRREKCSRMARKVNHLEWQLGDESLPFL